jgi:hypothetical protein
MLSIIFLGMEFSKMTQRLAKLIIFGGGGVSIAY